METERLRGDPVADEVRADVRERVGALREAGVVPTLGTVLMSDDPADRRFLELKHRACEAVGIETVDRRFDPDAPADRLYRAVEGLSADPDVHAVFVQAPLPEGVETMAVRERVAPAADVDCFHPENLDRLVAGEPRFLPATAAAVCRLLDASDVETEGADATVVGRSPVIGRPIATLLSADRSPGNATVTVCHSETTDLAEQTRRADLVVTAAGVPGLVDGSMLSRGATVVDVSANQVVADGDPTVVGDVDAASADGVAAARTPVPGGVGPVTVACLLANVALAAERHRDRDTAP
jgi:methylenetetrahydrofolate dehydrogenase (NADP+)/methenyltetrahydrofolate cyclohydrolase